MMEQSAVEGGFAFREFPDYRSKSSAVRCTALAAIDYKKPCLSRASDRWKPFRRAKWGSARARLK